MKNSDAIGIIAFSATFLLVGVLVGFACGIKMVQREAIAYRVASYALVDNEREFVWMCVTPE